MADERLDDDGRQKLCGLLAVGDPAGEVAAAHNAKERLRDLYTLWGQPDAAGRWLGALIADLARQATPKLRDMAHTPRRWKAQILARHTTEASKGPTEGTNSLIKKVKRIVAGSATSSTTGYASCCTRLQLDPAWHPSPFKREAPVMCRRGDPVPISVPLPVLVTPREEVLPPGRDRQEPIGRCWSSGGQVLQRHP